MRYSILVPTLLAATSLSLAAQQPGRGPQRDGPPRTPPSMMRGAMPGEMPGGMPGAMRDDASFLLGRTGELHLTDAQVVKLAAIARRAADRRTAMRATLDSVRPAMGRGGMTADSAGRAQMRQRMQQAQPAMERIRTQLADQSRTDRRDAIAVLTPDQQAQAWEMISARPMRGGMMRGANYRRR